MKALLTLVLLAAAGPALAQPPACAPLDTVLPVPPTEVRLTWSSVITWTSGQPIPTPTQMSYTVYERINTTDTAVCVTTALGTSIKGLAPGVRFWLVDAHTPLSTPPDVHSAKTGPASKSILPPTTPEKPLGINAQ